MGFSTIGGAGGGSEETPSGGAGSAEHAGVEDNSSSNADQIQINDTSVVINKDKDTNMDFRVAGDSGTNLLFCDSSADKIGIGTAAPVNTLHLHETGSGGPCVRLSNDTTGATVNDGFGFGMNSNESIYVWHRENNYIQWATNNTERMRLLAGGNFGIGTTSPDSLLEVSKASADAEVLISAYHDTEATTPKITFRKADNNEASPALVDDNAVLGTIDFLGHDGVNFERGAKIEARVQGTPGSNDLPTELTFWTTPDGSNTAAERMSIGADGGVALKSLAAVPAVTTGYSKLFAKSDVGLDTAVLMHFDNNWNDSGAQGLAAATATNAVFTSTGGEFKFGTHAAEFDGSGDFIELDGDSDHPAFNIGPGADFTVDFWLKLNTTSANQIIIESNSNSSNAGNTRINLGQDSSTGDCVSFQSGAGYQNIICWVHGGAITTDYQHWAFVQSGGTLHFFLDGVWKASGANPYDCTWYGGIRIGGISTGASHHLNGFMDEFRMLKKAAWLNNFTPPTEPYGGSTLQAIDAHGNVTRLSPHNEEGEWEYYSKNTKTGKTVRINMEEVVSDLGKLTGKNYIKDE